MGFRQNPMLISFMKYLNDKNISRPTRNDLRTFRDDLKLTHSANTVNSYMTGIRELFKYSFKSAYLYDIKPPVRSLFLISYTLLGLPVPRF